MEIENLEPRQKKVYKLLLKINKLASQAYLGTVYTLKQDENPDRFQQAANSIRHITGLISREVNIEYDESEYKKLIKIFNDILKWLNFEDKYEVEKLNIKYITQQEKLKKKITDKPNVLPKKIQESVGILISEWYKLNQYFIKVAHYDSEFVDETIFYVNFKRLEIIILELFKSSTEIKKKLNELMTISKPNDDHINLLSKYILKPADSHYFFTNLKNPKWFDLLKKFEFFTEPQGDKPGFFMIHFFPQMNYLKNVASTIPDKVLQVLNELQNTQNIIIRRSIIICIKNLPVNYITKTEKILEKITQSPDIALHSILKDICIDLINKSEFEFLIKILKIIFSFKGITQSSEDLLRFLLSGPKDLLKQIIKSNSSDLKTEFVKILLDLLDKYEEKKILEGVLFNIKLNQLDIEITRDILLNSENSEIWRSSIEDLPHSYKSGEFIGFLIDEIRDVFKELSQTDEGAFIDSYELLSNYTWMLFKRLQIYLIDKNFTLLERNLLKVINQGLIFNEKQVWAEIFYLLKNNFNNFSQEQKDTYFNWLNEEIDKYNNKDISKRYLLRLLNPILDYLPDDIKEEYPDLIEQSADFANIYKTPPDIFSYIEPISFLDPAIAFKEDLQNKTIEEIIHFLNSWKPSSKKIFESPSELGFSLSRQISSDSGTYLGLLDNFKEIPIPYLSHIINGFGRAFYDKKEFSYEKCINSLYKIVEFFHNSSKIQEEDILKIYEEIENALNYSIKLEQFKLTEDIFQKTIKISKSLLEFKNPNFISYKEVERSHKDSFFYYYNLLKCKTIESLISLNNKYLKEFKKEEDEPYLQDNIKEILTHLLETEYEDKEITNAVMGYYLYNLFYFDKEWTKTQINNIFPEQKENRNKWNAAWEAYIIRHKQNLNEIALDILNKQYKKAINKVQSPNISLYAKEALSTHLFLAYLHGHLGLDKGGLIYLYFKQANIDIRNRAMWDYFKNIFPYAKQKNNSFLDRYFSLWDYRIDQLAEAIKNKKITTKDAFKELKWYGVLFSETTEYSEDLLKRMEKIVIITNGISDVFIDNILKILQKYIDPYYKIVLNILSIYLQAEGVEGWLWFNRVESVRNILGSIKEKLDDLEDKAKYSGIIDTLHSKGYDTDDLPLEKD
ncbi:MAG: hypothetical protein ACTSQP_22650 [Promethearchaeota archaeon]